MTTLFYFLRREVGSVRAREVPMDLLTVLEVVAVDQDRIFQALPMDWEDFGGAVQVSCAAKAEVDYLLTRDREGFAGS